MDFELTEEQKIMQTTIRDFAKNELEPVADELDQAEEFPWKNFKRMAELGLTGMILPAEYGGSGSDELSLNIAIEEIAKACASTAHILDSHLLLCASPIYHFGNDEQRQRFLPPLAKGERVGSYGLTEPDAGSDITNIKLKAVKDGENYVLNGQKTFISNGEVCETAIVFASIPELAPRGMTAFVVEMGMPGFTKGKKFKKLGMRTATTAELFFEDCRVPEANRLGEEGTLLTNTAMAKLYGSELAMKAATWGIQIFGGYGYMMEYPMQRYFRDAKLTEIYEGTSAMQRLVISRAVLG